MNKTFFKSAPVALAMLALASCSNDDFLGTNTLSNKTQLLVEVETPYSEDGGMRAALSYTPASASPTGRGIFGTIWQVGDEFRVYDAALQVYDIFGSDNNSVVSRVGDPDVENNAYNKAIFPAKNVYYAGYDKASRKPIAVMKVPETLNSGKVVMNQAGGVAYVNELPLWGDVALNEDGSLKTTLHPLAAYAEVTVYQDDDDPVTRLRVLSLKSIAELNPLWSLSGNQWGNDYNEKLKKAEVSVIGGAFETEKPLAGYFEAVLDEEGVLTANLDNPLLTGDNYYKPYIEVELTVDAKETHVFLPIIEATYKNLVIQGYGSTSKEWKTIKCYTNENFPRNVIYRSGLVTKTPPTVVNVQASDLKDLSDRLKNLAQGNQIQDGNVVEVEFDGVVKTTNMYNQLILPDNKTDLTIHIAGTIQNGDSEEMLEITGGNNSSIVLDIDKVEGSKGIKVDANMAADLTLCGDYQSSKATGDIMQQNSIQIIGSSASKVTLGTYVRKFNTNMTVLLGNGGFQATNTPASTQKLTVDAGIGTIKAIEWTKNGNNWDATELEVLSGTVEEIGTKMQSNAVIKVGNTVDHNVKVGKITTNAGTITITETEVDNVTIKAVASTNAKATPQLSLVGGTGTNARIASVGALDLTKDDNAVWVGSTGKAAIKEVSNGKKTRFVSTWNDKDIATSVFGEGNVIYTAAQLAGLKASTNYTLRADEITIESGKAWTPVDLSGNFTVNVKDAAGANTAQINGLNAPLFGKISGTSTVGTKDNKLTLTASIALKTENQGVLAKAVDGTVTINYIEVGTSTIDGTAKQSDANNFGGLVGKAKGNVTLSNNKVNVTLTGYANLGGYVGNFEGGTLTMTVDNASSYTSTVAFNVFDSQVPYFNAAWMSDTKAGTVGMFIGSITGENALVKIIKNKDGVGDEFAHYFSSDVINNNEATLKFNNNWNLDSNNSKYFKGLKKYNHEIGYSPVQKINEAEAALYQKKDAYGYEAELKLADINCFE